MTQPCGPRVHAHVDELTKLAPDEQTARRLIRRGIFTQTAAKRTQTPCGNAACSATSVCAEVILGVSTQHDGGREVISRLDQHLEISDARYTDTTTSKQIDGVRVYFPGGTIVTTCECGEIA